MFFFSSVCNCGCVCVYISVCLCERICVYVWVYFYACVNQRPWRNTPRSLLWMFMCMCIYRRVCKCSRVRMCRRARLYVCTCECALCVLILVRLHGSHGYTGLRGLVRARACKYACACLIQYRLPKRYCACASVYFMRARGHLSRLFNKALSKPLIYKCAIRICTHSHCHVYYHIHNYAFVYSTSATFVILKSDVK